MKENSLFDKKSLQLITARNPDWKELAKDCVAFANAQGGEIHIGIEDDVDFPDKNQKIADNLIQKVNKIIPQQTINVGIKAEKCIAGNRGEFIKLRIFRSAQT
ncbi:MAG: putative DNA binding domain-containing protein, partial [Spirochaetales bacterium]|nr:putative DNA binding domain-containing protein [Spirochaetales bacterium]